MDRKRGKVLVGAVVAVTMGAFAVPFSSNASVPTGTTTPHQNSQLIQLAEEEHTELKEKIENTVNAVGEKTENKANEIGERTEDKAHEFKGEAAAGANEAEEHGGMRHEMKEKAERHVDEMGHEAKGAANAVENEHEAHEMNDR